MEQFAHISIAQTAEMLNQGPVQVVDIRDEASFAAGHIEGSTHLDNGSLHSFIQNTDFDEPVVVCCYHGRSSQQAAQYLIQQGFEQVYSLDGGFEQWKLTQPFSTNP